jgi:SAM-dependent methyltransferase
MRQATWALLGSVAGRVLDVGCGPGWTLAELPRQAWGVGLDRQRGEGLPQPFVMADAHRLPFAAGSFDVVLALDLLEQREVRPAWVLAEIGRVLRPGGRLLVRVPAHPWLFGPHDRLWGGARRYRRRELSALVAQARFRICRLTYANCILFPAEALVRLLARMGLAATYEGWPLPALLNRLLLTVLQWEARWLRRRDLPWGLSLLCLAENRTD